MKLLSKLLSLLPQQAADTVKLRGSLEATLFKAGGSVEVIRKDNLIMNVGYDYIVNCLCNGTDRPAILNYIAVGSGESAVTGEETALETELLRKETTFTTANANYAEAGTVRKSFSLQAEFLPGEATGAITEAGVLNAESAGVLFDRVVMAVINKGADDRLVVKLTFSFSDAPKA